MSATTQRLASDSIRSTDLRLPLWLRLVALAVEHDTQNRGVASFAPGQVRQLLDVEGLELHRASITRAIRRAEAYGFLGSGSSPRALIIVPGSLTVTSEGLGR